MMLLLVSTFSIGLPALFSTHAAAVSISTAPSAVVPSFERGFDHEFDHEFDPIATTQQQNGQDQQFRGSRGEITAQQFMQSLLAYGNWMAHPTFGWVWQPNDVQPWWQPFTIGDWIVTQDGTPYWRSGLPFGWATEHYGSWTFDENKGWLWIPSNDWSQAPVSWRATNGVIGWAPRMAAGSGGTATAVQTAPCAQPAFAWVFISSDR
ncbi:MAG: hypothetical protein QM516_08435, partial [Limnohabitans sp.]|nr:hypothetical protein [Limnohabitans sp.]